MPLFGAEAGI